MSALQIPNWCRMLGWGLLASLVLHWVAFDLMRAAAWVPRVPGATVLQVKLEANASRMQQTVEPVAVNKAPVSDKAGRIAASSAAGHRASPEVVSPVERTSTSHTGSVQIEGLRSGQPAEAMVALRLAIGKALAVDGPMPSLPTSILLWCDFDAEGRLLEVRGTSGTLAPNLQAWVRRAAAQTVTPDALVGRVFSLDILLESGD